VIRHLVSLFDRLADAVPDLPPDGGDVQVAVRGLSVWFGPVRALDAVSLDVRRGVVTVALGPSGSGKSTLLRATNRMLDSIRGVRIEGLVSVEGRDVREPGRSVEKLRARFGVVTQKPRCFPTTVFDNVAYGLRLHKLTRTPAQTEERVRFWLERVGLWEEVKDALRARPERLSLGQQQRLCIARALAYEPDILLLDEPCAALDPHNAALVETLLCELAGRHTVLVATHDLNLARRVAERIAVFWYGQVIEEGARDEVLERPREPVTRDYFAGRTG